MAKENDMDCGKFDSACFFRRVPKPSVQSTRKLQCTSVELNWAVTEILYYVSCIYLKS